MRRIRRARGTAVAVPLLVWGLLGVPVGPADASYGFSVAFWSRDSFDSEGFPADGVEAGVATDADGDVYYAARLDHEIWKFDADGNRLDSWGAAPQPRDLALDADGNVFVTDVGNRVQKFDADGDFVLAFGWGVEDGADAFQICTADCRTGRAGSGEGQFDFDQLLFSGIATDAGGNVYVADPANDRIQRFDAGGHFLAEWGTSGSGDGEFDEPSGLATDPGGNVYVADILNHRVQKFDADGGFLAELGASGSGEGELNLPLDVATDAAGNVYVTDAGANRVQKYDASGNFLARWGRGGSRDGEFQGVDGVATGPDGAVYVTDGVFGGPPGGEIQDNALLQKFTPLPPETRIDDGPSGLTNDTTPTFTFSSEAPGAAPGYSGVISFECSLDRGTPSYSPCSGPGASHTPATPLDGGPYTFRVRALDSEGRDPSPATRSFTVNRSPVADAGGPYHVDEGSEVVLDGTGSSDPEGGSLTYEWSPGTHLDDATSPTPTYRGGDDVVDTLTLTVADPGGLDDSDETTVTVTNVDPEATIDRSGATTIDGATPFLASAGDPVTFTGRATDPGSDDLHLTWDWGDGSSTTTTSLVDPPDPDSHPSPSEDPRDVTETHEHAFSNACVYEIAFLVEDDDGGEDSDTADVLVTGNADDPRSAGYWRHQFRQKGRVDLGPDEVVCYLAAVGHVSRVFDEARDASDRPGAIEVLDVSRNDGDMRQHLDRQLLTALLNFANGAYDWDEDVDTEGDGVPDSSFGDAVSDAESVRLDPGADRSALEEQKDILERLNTS